MGKSKIYEDDWLYNILRPIVDRNIKSSYRRVEIRGEENLPDDGPFILSPNHCNTLMDALVLLRANKKETVFGARADMFNNAFLAKLMFFFRILPMVRQRDGLRNVLKNVETQESIVETLENDVPFCMFPEGRHQPAKSLLPLGKGIFRAALAASAKFGDSKPVYIVPVGIEYGDFFRYRSTSLITYGKPINVTEYIRKSNTENEAQLIEPLRRELAERMSALFTYIPGGDYLDQKWTLLKMLSIARSSKPYGDFGTCIYDCMSDNRDIAASIEAAFVSHPDEMKDIMDDVRDFDKHRRRDGISIYSFRRKNETLNMTGKTLAALIGLPYFVFSAAASLPMWVTEKIIRSKIKDRAFRNTVSFGVKLAMGLIWIPVVAVISFCLAPWYLAAGITLLSVPAYNYFHDYIEGMRRFISDIRLTGCKKLRKKFAHIVEAFDKL